MRIAAADVDEYMTKVPPRRREAMQQLRELVESTADDLVVDMAYGMPTYRVGEHVLCAYASQKNYMSLYLDMDRVKKYRTEFGSLNCGKSCVRFTRIEQLPVATVVEILQETYAARKASAR